MEEDVCILEGGARFFQEKEGFRFGSDIVLLADFICEFAKEGQTNLEIGTGNGILPVLLQQKHFTWKDYLALDILQSNIDLAKKNWEENHVELRSLCVDVKDFPERNRYSQIFVNPPYMSLDGKLQNQNSEKTVARHEIALSLEELIQTVKKILAPIGVLYMVHRSQRLQEILELFSKYGLSVSKIRFVYHENGTMSNLVLLEVYKGKKAQCQILKPKYIK